MSDETYDLWATHENGHLMIEEGVPVGSWRQFILVEGPEWRLSVRTADMTTTVRVAGGVTVGTDGRLFQTGLEVERDD